IADEIEGLNASPSAITNNYITNLYASSSAKASTSGTLLGSLAIGDLSVDNLAINTGITSFGTSTFYDLSVASNIFIGAQFSISNTSINVLGDDLKLQPLKQGGIAFVGGEVYIDPQGNLTVQGNARFAKDVEIQGRLLTSLISPLPGGDLVFQLDNEDGSESSQIRNSKFEIRNSTESALLSLNERGDLVASGAATFGKLNLGLVSPALALSDTELIATGSAGVAFIKPYKTEVTVVNSLVTENSLIYITPVGITLQAPYLVRQKEDESFTVGVPTATTSEIKFNWLIIN
ncbi:MAG: hypothetical protein UU21_C0008G0024, partial [Candidatus Levybacteria bacterium GW2011_GWA2_40_8]